MGRLKSYFDGRKYLTFIYTILLTVFSIIIQVSLTRMFLGLSLGSLDFIIIGVVSILCFLLIEREVKIEVVALIGIILGGIMINVLHGGDLMFRYLFMIILHIIILVSNRCIEITREEVKSKATKMMIWIFISSFGFIDKNEKYFYLLGQLAITFFIIYIYLLRRIREFYYKFKKENTKQNIAYCIFILLLLVDSTQKIFIMAFKVVVGIITSILAEIVGILAIVLGPIASKIYIPQELLDALLKLDKQTSDSDIMEKTAEAGENILGLKTEIVRVIQAVSVIIIIILIYFIIKKVYFLLKSEENNSGIRIEREKIKKRNDIRKKEKVKNPVTIKEKILYSYREFLIKAKNKNLYKEYMTGRQVQSRVGAEVCQVQEELKAMTSIYNEVKFSNHEVDVKKLEDFNENYDKVKSEFR